jgi:16S rRNA (cytosine967-C5)-methyltransferase
MKRAPVKEAKVRRNPPPQPRRRSRHAPGAETLLQALVVHEVISKAAPPTLRSSLQGIDRAAVRVPRTRHVALVPALKPALTPLINRPFDELSPLLAALLVTAAHQVEYSRGAAEAQVHLAVDASRVLEEGRASGVVNAVLRRFVAQRVELFATVDADLAQRHAHPRWLVDALVDAWGDSAAQILIAKNEHPPMVLRVDTGQIHVEDSCDRGARWVARRAPSTGAQRPWCWSALLRTDSSGSKRAVSVQDAGAQLAAPLLERKPACGARRLRGTRGKHSYRATHAGFAELVAVDDDARDSPGSRKSRARAARGGAAGADLRTPAVPGRTFRPRAGGCACSATGVIRRIPISSIAPAERHRDLCRDHSNPHHAFELLEPADVSPTAPVR